MAALFTSQKIRNQNSIIDDYFDEEQIAELISKAFGMVKNLFDAEDAVLETYIKAKENVSVIEKLSSWINRVLYTTCLNVIRSRKSIIEYQDIRSNKEINSLRTSVEDSLENESLITQLLNIMTKNEKEVFELSTLGYTPQEIADKLSRTVDSVYSAQERYRNKIKVFLQIE